MKKNVRTVTDIQEENKSFNLGEVVRMRTGDEKPRFTTNELEEVKVDLEKRYPDTPELLDCFARLYGAKTGQEVRDILIYGMLKEVLFTLDKSFNASKDAALDNMSIAKIRDLQFNASFKHKINP